MSASDGAETPASEGRVFVSYASQDADAYLDGHDLVRRELDLPGGSEPTLVSIELEPSTGDTVPETLDARELGGRQIHFLERDVVLEASVRTGGDFGTEWESVQHDYCALTLEVPHPAEIAAQLPAGYPGEAIGTLYLRNDDTGATLVRELGKAESGSRKGRFVVRIPLRRYDPEDGTTIHAELLSWTLE